MLAAVVLNKKLSFCHKCGSESRSAVESIVASMSGWCVLGWQGRASVETKSDGERSC